MNNLLRKFNFIKKNIDKNLLNYLYWFYVLVLGLIFVFVIPPFLKFDEIYHFGRAASVYEGNVSCVIDNGKQSYKVSTKYTNLNEKLNIDVYGIPIGGKFLWHELFNNKTNNSDNFDKVVFNCTPPFGYITGVLGIFLGLGNTVLSFYMARLMSFLFFIFCLVWSLKKIDKNYRIIVYVYSLVPMVLYQVTAVNYDVIQLSLIMPILVVFTNFFSKTKIKIKELLLFLFLLIFFQSVKPSYYLFGFLPLLIPYKKIFKSKFKCIFLFLIYFLINFACVYLILKNFYGNSSSDTGYLPLVNIKYQFEFIKNDPIYFLRTLFDNFNINGGFYLKSMLGWASSEYSFITYLLLNVPFIYAVFNLTNNSKKIIKLSLLRIIYLLIIIFGTLFAILLTFYLNWTIVGSNYISGVQGRYFLVLIPFLFFILAQLVSILGKDLFIKINLLIFAAVTIYQLVAIPIVKNFYDYSENFIENESFDLSNKKVEYVNIADKEIKYKKMDGYKVGGFEFMFNFNKAGYVDIPYKYELLDVDCKKTLVKGYLNLARLSAGGTYKETFGIKKLPNELCVRFTPIIKDKNKNFIQIAKINNIPIFQLLYITK